MSREDRGGGGCEVVMKRVLYCPPSLPLPLWDGGGSVNCVDDADQLYSKMTSSFLLKNDTIV